MSSPTLPHRTSAPSARRRATPGWAARGRCTRSRRSDLDLVRHADTAVEKVVHEGLLEFAQSPLLAHERSNGCLRGIQRRDDLPLLVQRRWEGKPKSANLCFVRGGE